MPGVVRTPFPLVQPVHGYNALTLTSITFLVTTTVGKDLTRMKSFKAVFVGLPLLRTNGILFVKATLRKCHGLDSQTVSAPWSMAMEQMAITSLVPISSTYVCTWVTGPGLLVLTRSVRNHWLSLERIILCIACARWHWTFYITVAVKCRSRSWFKHWFVWKIHIWPGWLNWLTPQLRRAGFKFQLPLDCSYVRIMTDAYVISIGGWNLWNGRNY